MGRPSKLTDAQWAEVERRMLKGESIRALATEFRLSEAAIRKRLSAVVEKTKNVANQMVATERELKSLPIGSQMLAMDLASELRSISSHLAHAAKYGAATSHRLHALAHNEVQKIDDTAPLKSVEALKGVSALTRLANDAASTGLNLLAANKKDMEPGRKTLEDLVREAGAVEDPTAAPRLP